MSAPPTERRESGGGSSRLQRRSITLQPAGAEQLLHRRPSCDDTGSLGEAFFGGAASALACIVSNPIDIVRCRMQLESVGRVPSPSSSSLLHRWGPLTAGLGPAMAYNVVLNSARFSLFHATVDKTQANPMIAGFFSGGIAGFVSSPLARWRTLLQSGFSAQSARSLTRTQPFAGAPAWALRNAGHTACIFSFFEVARVRIEDARTSSDRLRDLVPPTCVHLAASLVAATASCFPDEPPGRLLHAPLPRRWKAAHSRCLGEQQQLKCRLKVRLPGPLGQLAAHRSAHRADLCVYR